MSLFCLLQIEHEDWWTRTKFFHQRRRDLLIGWIRDRAELLDRVKNVFNEACLAKQLEDVKQENRQKQQEFCDYLYAKVWIVVHVTISIDAWRSPRHLQESRWVHVELWRLPWFFTWQLKHFIGFQGGFCQWCASVWNQCHIRFFICPCRRSRLMRPASCRSENVRKSFDSFSTCGLHFNHVDVSYLPGWNRVSRRLQTRSFC